MNQNIPLNTQSHPSLSSRLEDGTKPQNRVLTIPEVAALLRVSKAHVYKLVEGTVTGVTPLPALRMGRRRLVLSATLDRWQAQNESNPPGSAILPSTPEVDAA
jgi:excisionase family DNA binding protein